MPVYGFYSKRVGLGNLSLPPTGVLRVEQIDTIPNTLINARTVVGKWVIDPGIEVPCEAQEGSVVVSTSIALGFAEFANDEEMLAAMEVANTKIEPIVRPSDYEKRQQTLADLEELIARLKKIAEGIRWENISTNTKYYMDRKVTYRAAMGIDQNNPRNLPIKVSSEKS